MRDPRAGGTSHAGGQERPRWSPCDDRRSHQGHRQDGRRRHLLRRRAQADLRRRACPAALRVGAPEGPSRDLRPEGVQRGAQRSDDRRAHRAVRALAQVTAPVPAATSAKRELAITGMTSASCVRSVESALSGVSGVESADVNLANERATVRLDPATTELDALVHAVARAGYGALVIPEGDAARAAAVEDERALRLRYVDSLRRRLAVAGVLAAAAVVLSMAAHVIPELEHADWRAYVLFALATPVQLRAAAPFYRAAWNAARHGTTNMNTLIAVGTTAAYGLSVAATFLPNVFYANGLEPHASLYFETSSAIIALVLAGRFMEARARAHTGDAIRALLALGAKTARVRRAGGVEEDVPIDRLDAGDVVPVRPGETIAAARPVLAGSSAVDESMLTRESIPVEQSAGDEVTGGKLSTTGALRLRTIRVGGDTTLAQIVRLGEHAQGSKAPIQRLRDQVASVFVPIGFAIPFAAFAAWILFGPAPALTHALTAFVAGGRTAGPRPPL